MNLRTLAKDQWDIEARAFRSSYDRTAVDECKKRIRHVLPKISREAGATRGYVADAAGPAMAFDALSRSTTRYRDSGAAPANGDFFAEGAKDEQD